MSNPLPPDKEFRGLSEVQVKEKLMRDGWNELPSSKRKSIFGIVLQVLKEPMLLLLVSCGVVYLILGDKLEAILLILWSNAVVGITLYQESKTERALEALKDLSSPRALVIRGGERKRIPGREVVEGDIIIVAEGDRIPADAAVLETSGLSVDESLLTGESAPASKIVWDGVMKEARAGGDDLPFVYSGTLVTQGKATCRVLSTGLRTEIGKIGKSLQALGGQEDMTHAQRETLWLVKTMSIIAAVVSVLVCVLYALRTKDILQGMLGGISLAMSLLPEEIPVVMTIFLALGAWRISRHNVLTRRVSAIEMLGAATVLCADKTGTLTLNRMTVRRLMEGDVSLEVEEMHGNALPERFHSIVEYSILASHRDPFDPMEKAFKQLGELCLRGTEHLHADWSLVREYPLSPALLAMSEVWRSRDGGAYVIASKGAPEAIVDLCHLEAHQQEEVLRQASSMAKDGLRVIAVAAATFEDHSLPDGQHDFPFRFIGMLGLADPIRPDVPQAVRECRQAGIRVIMITGDHPHTAESIAREIGLPEGGGLLTGAEMDLLSDDQLQERVKTVSVFARVVPEQKLRLVEALRANDEVVAMTGDGVNDAPALKAAHIGIAMGGRGTDVAREASDLVLLDDNFASIVKAVRMGRRIFDNLKKAMSYIVAIHIPIAGIALVPALFGMPLIFSPVHIMFLEMIIDPACTIIFEMEPEERNIMHRPPHDAHEPMFGKRRLLLSLLQGLGVLVALLIVFTVGLLHTDDFAQVRALTFTTLIVANIGLILLNRSWTRTIIESLRTRNVAVGWVVGGAGLFLALALFVPFLQPLFRFSPLSLAEILFALSMAFVSVVWFDILKMLLRTWKQFRMV